MRRRTRILVVILILILLGGGWLYASSRPDLVERWTAALKGAPANGAGLGASGTIEAEMVSITSETGGRVAELGAEEGDEVIGDQVLVQLSTSLVDADIYRAKAALGVAEAALALVRAGAPTEAIAQAEALVAQAETARDGAYLGWLDAQAIRDAPQELDVKLAAAQNEAALARQQTDIAQLLAQSADLEQAMYERLVNSVSGGILVEVPGPGGPTKIKVPAGPENVFAANYQWNLASQRTWQAYAALHEAQIARDAAWKAAQDLQRELDQPLALEARVNAAEASYREAEAAVSVTRSVVDDLKAGARAEDIAVAQAAVREAEAALDALLVQRDKLSLHAPRDGLVVERNVRVGETVTPGASVMKLAYLEGVTLKLYVPVSDLGRVKLGQKVRVVADALPQRSFEGAITYIASEAEFTPKSVQTKEERVNMVFAVSVEIPNPDMLLKPGMPAEAVIQVQE